MSSYRKLTAQKKHFVDLLVRRVRPMEAMKQIRPQLKRPDVLAAKWKALPEVQLAIEERELEAMEAAGITNAQILLGIASYANVSMKDFVHADGRPKSIHELDDATARAIQSIEVETTEKGVTRTKFRLPSKIEAQKLLGQSRKLFTEKVDVTPIGPLRIEVVKFAEHQDPST